MPIVDQCVYIAWLRNLQILFSGYTHGESTVVGNGRAHVGKTDAILTDPHLVTINSVKGCIL